jgi:hypothetical protein
MLLLILLSKLSRQMKWMYSVMMMLIMMAALVVIFVEWLS